MEELQKGQRLVCEMLILGIAGISIGDHDNFLRKHFDRVHTTQIEHWTLMATDDHNTKMENEML